jgi:hypothetical protein
VNRAPTPTLVELDELRKRACQCFKEGLTPAATARVLGVTRTSAWRWKKLWAQANGRLMRPGNRGRKPRLTAPHLASIHRLLQRPPADYGFQQRLWNNPLAREAIHSQIGIQVTHSVLRQIAASHPTLFLKRRHVPLVRVIAKEEDIRQFITLFAANPELAFLPRKKVNSSESFSLPQSHITTPMEILWIERGLAATPEEIVYRAWVMWRSLSGTPPCTHSEFRVALCKYTSIYRSRRGLRRFNVIYERTQCYVRFSLNEDGQALLQRHRCP